MRGRGGGGGKERKKLDLWVSVYEYVNILSYFICGPGP